MYSVQPAGDIAMLLLDKTVAANLEGVRILDQAGTGDIGIPLDRYIA